MQNSIAMLELAATKQAGYNYNPQIFAYLSMQLAWLTAIKLMQFPHARSHQLAQL